MGDKGIDACPKGYEEIYDVNICKSASNSLGLAYSEDKNDGNTSSVCVWCGGCAPKIARVTSRHGTTAQWICQKGMRINNVYR